MASLHQKYGRWAQAASLFLLLACGCDSKKTPPEPPPNPLSVRLTSAIGYFVGDAVSLTSSIQGCGKIVSSQLFQGNHLIQNLLLEAGTTSFTVPKEAFEPLFAELGIAARLALKIRAECEDGRINDSPPHGISFFPAASIVEREDGMMAATDSFIAVGGNNSPTTFWGCSADEQGAFLAHFDTQGDILHEVRLNDNRIQCNASTQITPPVNGYRWAYTLGAEGSMFAFRDNPTSYLSVPEASTWDSGSFEKLSVDSSGNAFVVVFSGTTYTLSRVSLNNQRSNSPMLHPSNNSVAFPIPPTLVQGVLLLPVWTVPWVSSSSGYLEMRRFNPTSLAPTCGSGSGLPVPPPCPVIANLDADKAYNGVPLTPGAVFSKDATSLYLAEFDERTQSYFVAVYEINPLNSTTNPQRTYRTSLFESLVIGLQISRDETFLVASTSQSTRFLGIQATDNNRLPLLNEKPIMSSSELMITKYAHGTGRSLVILNSALFSVPTSLTSSEIVPGWPIEAIAIDSPENGELWRFNYWEKGDAPLTAIAVAIDEGGQMWMRTGAKLVKLLPQSYYRQLKPSQP
ncbi:MAG: hypothetical protein FWG75_02240 [Cystobacterineae bacterium]|nr:hypothetical protein [Cystobacterineae bacterium]